jgi:hypothetical protein
MQFMIIEHFRKHQLKEMYNRFETNGRMLPEGVQYINSWIDENVSTCYQVMESDSVEKIQEWISHWQDLVDFEIIPVISSAKAKEKVMSSN